jgi:hypothetical protein
MFATFSIIGENNRRRDKKSINYKKKLSIENGYNYNNSERPQ